jgi:hypothetical protein
MQPERNLDFYVSTEDANFNSKLFAFFTENNTDYANENAICLRVAASLYEAYFFICENYLHPFKCLQEMEKTVDSKKLNQLELNEFSDILFSLLYSHSNGTQFFKILNLFGYFNSKYDITEKSDGLDEEYVEYIPESRFDFNSLKEEVNKLEASLLEKVIYIKQRLYDFYQWQHEFDRVALFSNENDSNKQIYEMTDLYYPKFEGLCLLEIERLEKLIATADGFSLNQTKNTKSPYSIASKRKTDVVKILSAMYDSKLFANADGQPATNKQELMEAFGVFLGEDLKAYSTLLSQAKEKNPDLYLKTFDDLKRSANDYCFK